MTQHSPTLEGFKIMFRQPSLGLAEIAWRWSFGGAATALFLFSIFEYLDTLPVSAGNRLLLRTRHPLLVSQAIANIFRGSSVRLVETVLLVALLLGISWIAIASLGRAATLRALMAHFRGTTELNPGRLSSLFGLNFFRATTTLAAWVGFVGAFLVAYLVSPHNAPAPAITILVILGTGVLVWLAWSSVNWFLSLASLFVVADREDTFGAMFAAVDLCRRRAGSLFAAGTWFGLAHLAAFVLATTVVAFPLGLIELVRARAVLAGVVLITLLYFAVVDFLYIGRLAAYVAILELPDTPVIPAIVVTSVPPTGQQPALVSAVDPDELILSDLPAVEGKEAKS